VLLVPNLLNAGATRMDDENLYPMHAGDVEFALRDNIDTLILVYTQASSQQHTAAVPEFPVTPSSVPEIRLDVSVHEGTLAACTGFCDDIPQILARAEPSAPGAFVRGFQAREAQLPVLPAALAAPLAALPLEAASLPGRELGPGLTAQGAGPLPGPGGALAPEAAMAAAVLFAALALGPLALYSRIRRDAALSNDTRRQVYDAVAATPGLSIQAVARSASISHSTAAYHLERLAEAGLVVATGDGNKVRYYRNGGRFTETERKLLPCLENAETVRVLERILRRPWSYRAEIASQLEVTATTVNWHLKRLFGAGVLAETREGRNAYLFAQRAPLLQACSGLQSKMASGPARDAAERLLLILGSPPTEPVASGPAAPASVPPVVFPAPAQAGTTPAQVVALPTALLPPGQPGA
jgi:DNA-binding transcriptional ArsR family regulator